MPFLWCQDPEEIQVLVISAGIRLFDMKCLLPGMLTFRVVHVSYVGEQ